MSSPLSVAVIMGSVRQNRFCDKPAAWIHRELQKRDGIEATLIDLREHPLPFFDRPVSPAMSKPGDYGDERANAWAKVIANADAYVLVSPEYNHSTSGVLKNALDTVYHEWNNKAVGFVSYGSVGGARAVEHLRLIAAELQMASVRGAVYIPWDVMGPIVMGKAEWDAGVEEKFASSANTMIDQLTAWGNALKAVRQ